MVDYNKVALKIGKMGFFIDIHNCGGPTEHFPVNLYCESRNIRIYVACEHLSRYEWSIDYTRNKNISKRTDMTHINGLRNQTETLKAVECLLNNANFAIDKDGRCVA